MKKKLFIIIFAFLLLISSAYAIMVDTPTDCDFSLYSEEENLIELGDNKGLVTGELTLHISALKERCEKQLVIFFTPTDGYSVSNFNTFEYSLLQDIPVLGFNKTTGYLELDLSNFYGDKTGRPIYFDKINFSYYIDLNQDNPQREVNTASGCNDCEGSYLKVFVLPPDSELISSPPESSIHKREGKYVIRFRDKTHFGDNLIKYKNIERDKEATKDYQLKWILIGASISAGAGFLTSIIASIIAIIIIENLRKNNPKKKKDKKESQENKN